MLDQHRAGRGPSSALASGALSTHLDPDYRMQMGLTPHLSRDAKQYIAIFAAIIVGVPGAGYPAHDPQGHQGKQMGTVQQRQRPDRPPAGGECALAAAYAVGFTPDGRVLRVVIDRPEAWPSPAGRDTVFTWQVTGSGDLSDLTTIFSRRQRRPADTGPGRPHRGRRLPHRQRGTPVDPALTRTVARTGP